MTEASINNGELVDVALVDFVGKAGFVSRVGSIQLAYAANRGGSITAVGTIILIDGARYRVTKGGRSSYASHLTVLDLEPVA